MYLYSYGCGHYILFKSGSLRYSFPDQVHGLYKALRINRWKFALLLVYMSLYLCMNYVLYVNVSSIHAATICIV